MYMGILGVRQNNIINALTIITLTVQFAEGALFITVSCLHLCSNSTAFSQLWCTHVGQEEPKLVYTLFCCKLVKLLQRIVL